MIAFVISLVLGLSPTSRIQTVRYPSVALAERARYEVYLPPAYDATRAYPVMLLLHGLGGAGADWFDPTQGDLQRIADELIGAGKLTPFIAIAPDGHDGYWTDHISRARGTAYGAAVIEALEHAKGRYRLSDTAVIVGVSAGGHGALSVGLRERARFKAIASLSGALFDEPPTHRPIYLRVWGQPADLSWFEATAPMRILRALPPSTPIPALWLAAGKDETERFLPWNVAADTLLTQKKIPHTFITCAGGHGWTTWRNVAVEWLAWIDAFLR